MNNSLPARYGQRAVLTHRYPGLPSWLESAGHGSGTTYYRGIRASVHPDPGTPLVSLAEPEALRAEQLAAVQHRGAPVISLPEPEALQRRTARSSSRRFRQ